MKERKHLIAVLIMVFVLTLLFQFSAVIKGSSLDYTVNHAIEVAGMSSQIVRSKAYDLDSAAAEARFEEVRPRVAFVGSVENNPYLKAVREFATFAKWRVDGYARIADFLDRGGLHEGHQVKLLVLDVASTTWPDDVEHVRQVQEAGVPVVLTSLPSHADVAAHRELAELLGIARTRESQVRLTGLHLYAGLLLGGAKVYERTPDDEHILDDVRLAAPWYVLKGGSKVYLRGEVDTQEFPDAYAHDEIIPPLMWRYSEGNAPLFVSYEPILTRRGGFGLIMAFVTEFERQSVWPVANAQALVTIDYPILARENDDEMARIYARDSVSLQRDIVWGSLSSLSNQTKAPLTFLAAPELTVGNSAAPDDELMNFYLRAIDELGGEVGLACDTVGGSTSSSKIRRDMAYFKKRVPDYDFAVASVRTAADFEALRDAGEVTGSVRTIVGDPSDDLPLVGYASGTVVRLGSVSDCRTFGALDDLALRASETGFGYSCVTFDLKWLTHPRDEEDQWQNGYRKMLASYSTYWKPFAKLRQVSATEAGAFVRQALSSDYRFERTGDDIKLTYATAGSGDGASFFLRLHDEHVVSVTGGAFQELEDGFYALLLTGEGTATVRVASDVQPTVVR